MSEVNKLLSGVILELYKDSLQPSARIWGNFFGVLANRRVQTLRKNLLIAENKLQQENPKNIVSPKFDVAMPILEKMRYTEEEALAEAYAELLKNSCLKDRQAKVLPAYSEILSRLTSDEVRILDLIYRRKNHYKVLVKDVMKSKHDEFTQKYGHLEVSHETLESSMLYPVNGIPYLEVRSNAGKSYEGFITVVKYFTDINKKVTLSAPENFEVYIENLQSLGIFDVGFNILFPPISIYNCLVQEATRNYRSSIEQQGRTMELLRGRIEPTSLANSFLAMCTSSKHNEKSNAPTP